MNSETYTAQLVVAGDNGNGKTNFIINTLAHLGRSDVKEFRGSNVTLSVKVDGKDVNLKIDEYSGDLAATISLTHLARSATAIIFIYKATSKDSYNAIMELAHDFMSTHKESIAFVGTFNDSPEPKVPFAQAEYAHFYVGANTGFDATTDFISSLIRESLSSVKSEYEDAPEKKKTKKSKCVIL